jgi:TatA/E family protein of Tat protein translocase
MGMDTFLVILIVILIIVVMIRGPKTLPLIGGMLGRGVKEVRKGANELQASQDATPGETPTVPPTVPPAGPPSQPPVAPPAP